jgi:DNA polymerase-4
MVQAVRRCPDLVVVPPTFAAYRAASHQVMERLHALTPLVEQLSIDEAFLDVTALGAPGAAVAARLQATIHAELGLSCSLGIATNKLVAKIATDIGKGKVRSGTMPQAICVVPPGDEAAFLAPLPATALWGVGPKTAAKLAALGISTISDIATWPATDLARRFGQHGLDLARRARGRDDRPVMTERATKSISQETTFTHDVTDRATLERTLQAQAAEVAAKLHQHGLVATTVKLKLRWPDFTTPTRQLTVRQPTDAPDEIGAAALRLFHQIWTGEQAVRLIGVGVSGLGSPPHQLSLWEVLPPEELARQQRVQTALTAIQARFGAGVVQRACDVGHAPTEATDVRPARPRSGSFADAPARAASRRRGDPGEE